jgi:hypothetical protein
MLISSLHKGRKDLPGTEIMSWIQAQEELDYNRDDSEYLAVLRADHYDPEDHFWFCEEHELTLARTADCPECPAWVPSEAPVLYDPADEPPF